MSSPLYMNIIVDVGNERRIKIGPMMKPEKAPSVTHDTLRTTGPGRQTIGSERNLNGIALPDKLRTDTMRLTVM